MAAALRYGRTAPRERIPHERGDKRMAKKAAKGGKKKGGKKR
jgi:hypothetical protein